MSLPPRRAALHADARTAREHTGARDASVVLVEPSVYTTMIFTNMARLLAVVERVGVVGARLLATMR